MNGFCNFLPLYYLEIPGKIEDFLPFGPIHWAQTAPFGSFESPQFGCYKQLPLAPRFIVCNG